MKTKKKKEKKFFGKKAETQGPKGKILKLLVFMSPQFQKNGEMEKKLGGETI